MTADNDWTLNPGELIERRALHDSFGGGRQGGIGPSRQSPNVFIFFDRASGEQHGYIDDWQEDGCLHYTGEGQRGDQVMKAGNAAILNHRRDGRALRIFAGVGGTVEYMDEFEIDATRPWYTTDAPETGDGPIRSVIVFRLRPKTIAPRPGAGYFRLSTTDEIDHVPVEDQHTERMFVEPHREPYEAERREAALVLDFRNYLAGKGYEVTRLRIRPEGEAKPLYSDLYIAGVLLVEAKGSIERGAVRMALGQLLDYGRFVPEGVRRAILLPSKPRRDVLALIRCSGVAAIWRHEAGFRHSTLGLTKSVAEEAAW